MCTASDRDGSVRRRLRRGRLYVARSCLLLLPLLVCIAAGYSSVGFAADSPPSKKQAPAASKKAAAPAAAQVEEPPLVPLVVPPPPAVKQAGPPAPASPPPAAPKPSAEPAAPKALKPVRVAVYELTGSGLDKKHMGLITDSLIAEIRKLEKVSAIGMNEIQAMLSMEEQRQMVGCSEEGCLLEVAAALGSDYLVTGSIGSVGESTVLTLKRLEMRTGRATGTYNRRMKGGGGEEFLESIGPAVSELFPERPLRQGMKRGVDPEIVARWNPPPLKPWVFWTGVGLTGASLVMAGLCYWQTTEAEKAWSKEQKDRQAPVGRYNELNDRYQNWRLATFVTLGTAGAFALTTGILALFTDWRGDVVVTPAATSAGPGVAVKASF